MEFLLNFGSNFDTLQSSLILLEFQIYICEIKGPDQSFWFIRFSENVQDPHINGEMRGLTLPQFLPVFQQLSV